MGQKSNPIILRLEKTNQSWSSCWYGDYNYTSLFLEDCRIQAYIQNCTQQLRKNSPILFIQRSRGQKEIALFFPRPQRKLLTPAREAKYPHKEFSFTPLFDSLPNVSFFAEFSKQFPPSFSKMLIGQNKSIFFRSLLFAVQGGTVPGYGRQNIKSNPVNTVCRAPNKIHPEALALSGSTSLSGYTPLFGSLVKDPISRVFSWKAPLLRIAPLGWQYIRRPSSKSTYTSSHGLKNHLEFSIYRQNYSRCKVYLLKCPSMHQNPFFLATQVVFSLEKRISFRQMKHRIIREISSNPIIKGVRITCSGRVAARSKKAQKARTESIQYGETGLNVFHSLVHFASKSAQTAFGKIGVKVWVCYHG